MLRDYQESAIKDILEALQQHNSVLYQLPTGGGKTKIAEELIKQLKEEIWFVVHRKELMDQTSRRFREAGIAHSFIASGYVYVPHVPVKLVMIQTFVSRKNSLIIPKYIITDEAHRSKAESYSQLPQQAKRIGLTATPSRLDGKGLHDIFEILILGPKVSKLIDNGFLCPFKIKAPPNNLDLSTVHTAMGDYNMKELESALDQSNIFGDVVGHYKRFLDGKKAIVFCALIKHSERIAEQFREAGIEATHVDGKTPSEQREQAFRFFREGKIRILSNCNLATEGIDVPDCDAVICLRPTQSLTMHLQQLGRVLRPSPGKDHALILDHVGNCLKHGGPDEEHPWEELFYTIKKKKQEDVQKYKICPKCYAAISIHSQKCPECEYVFPRKEVEELKQIDGDLVDFDSRINKTPDEKRAIMRTLLPSCKSMKDFRDLAVKLGNKPGSGYYMYQFYSSCKQRNCKTQYDFFKAADDSGGNRGLAVLMWEAHGKREEDSSRDTISIQ